MGGRTDALCLGWWAEGGPLLSAPGLRQVIVSLSEFLPEAVPNRWDTSEDFRYRIVDQGLDGLVDFVESHRWGVLLRAKAPGRRIELYPVPPSQNDNGLRSTCLLIELDVSVLDRRGAGERVSEAFEQLGAAIEPFYAEARLLRGVARRGRSALPHRPFQPQYPFWSNSWYGLPVEAPFAALLGSPYRQLWPDFGSREAHGMSMENPPSWHRDLPSLSWRPPEGLCQPFDVHFAQIVVSDAEGIDDPILEYEVRFRPGNSYQLMIPQTSAPVRPFAEVAVPVPGPRPTLADLHAILSTPGSEEIRQVAVDDDDGEPFERWERSSAESNIRGVYVQRVGYPGWQWLVTVAALEYVRAEPLESRLRDALVTAAWQVPGVTGVAGEDRETLLIAGTASGQAVTRALSGVLDDMADEVRTHHNTL